MSDEFTVPEIIVTIRTDDKDKKESGKYHDPECCEWTRGVDSLLERYASDRAEITHLITHDPNKLVTSIWKGDGPLAIDNKCRCQMGKGEKRSPFACAQCKNLRRLIDFRLGGVERPFQVECGKKAGKTLIVSKTDISNLFLQWDNESAKRARIYLHQYQNLTTCGTPDLKKLQCITGDQFTTRTLIMWMVSKIFTEKGLPHCPMMHTAFVCNDTGYSLYNMPSIGTISELHKIAAYHEQTTAPNVLKSKDYSYTPLKTEVARSIILQLLAALKELSTINFSHGTPSIYGLIFDKDPVSYIYDGVKVTGPLTLQISDMWNASATFNDVHYFPRDVKSSLYLSRGVFIPEITSKFVSMAYCHEVGAVDETQEIACPENAGTTCPTEETYDVCKSRNVAVYRLTSNTVDIYNSIRHIGFPLYVGSFDFYCFMVALMCDKSFFDTVVADEKLYRLWSMMWMVEDIQDVERMIKESHDIAARGDTPVNNRASANMIIDIIRGPWLRCDVVKYIWALVKKGW